MQSMNQNIYVLPKLALFSAPLHRDFYQQLNKRGLSFEQVSREWGFGNHGFETSWWDSTPEQRLLKKWVTIAAIIGGSLTGLVIVVALVFVIVKKMKKKKDAATKRVLNENIRANRERPNEVDSVVLPRRMNIVGRRLEFLPEEYELPATSSSTRLDQVPKPLLEPKSAPGAGNE
jgi:hypothetical protein